MCTVSSELDNPRHGAVQLSHSWSETTVMFPEPGGRRAASRPAGRSGVPGRGRTYLIMSTSTIAGSQGYFHCHGMSKEQNPPSSIHDISEDWYQETNQREKNYRGPQQETEERHLAVFNDSRHCCSLCALGDFELWLAKICLKNYWILF